MNDDLAEGGIVTSGKTTSLFTWAQLTIAKLTRFDGGFDPPEVVGRSPLMRFAEVRSAGWRRLRSRALRFAGLSLPVALAGCGTPILNPQGPVGEAEKTILLNAIAVMLVIVVPTILATLAVAWWFRASNRRAHYRPEWTYSGRIELVTWSIPMLVILFLGGVTWIGSHQLDPAEPLKSPTPPLEVEVVSLDWKWLFIYPDQGVASVNRLVIPAGTPIHFRLTSASVMNVFFVPDLGSMIYTMNGMSGQLWLQADQPGVYRGRSAHFSGDGFSDMSFSVDAVPMPDFETWVGKAHAEGTALDDEAYAILAKQSANVAPFTYRTVVRDLFDSVVSLRQPPGPGPGSPPTSVGVPKI